MGRRSPRICHRGVTATSSNIHPARSVLSFPDNDEVDSFKSFRHLISNLSHQQSLRSFLTDREFKIGAFSRTRNVLDQAMWNREKRRRAFVSIGQGSRIDSYMQRNLQDNFCVEMVVSDTFLYGSSHYSSVHAVASTAEIYRRYLKRSLFQGKFNPKMNRDSMRCDWVELRDQVPASFRNVKPWGCKEDQVLVQDVQYFLQNLKFSSRECRPLKGEADICTARMEVANFKPNNSYEQGTYDPSLIDWSRVVGRVYLLFYCLHFCFTSLH